MLAVILYAVRLRWQLAQQVRCIIKTLQQHLWCASNIAANWRERIHCKSLLKIWATLKKIFPATWSEMKWATTGKWRRSRCCLSIAAFCCFCCWGGHCPLPLDLPWSPQQMPLKLKWQQQHQKQQQQRSNCICCGASPSGASFFLTLK